MVYKRTDARGYVQIHQPHHPRANSWGYVYEQILVAEEKIGRPLYKNEVAHHINENPNDNRPENIIVMDFAEHRRLHGKLRIERRILKEEKRKKEIEQEKIEKMKLREEILSKPLKILPKRFEIL